MAEVWETSQPVKANNTGKTSLPSRICSKYQSSKGNSYLLLLSSHSLSLLLSRPRRTPHYFENQTKRSCIVEQKCKTQTHFITEMQRRHEHTGHFLQQITKCQRAFPLGRVPVHEELSRGSFLCSSSANVAGTSSIFYRTEIHLLKHHNNILQIYYTNLSNLTLFGFHLGAYIFLPPCVSTTFITTQCAEYKDTL